MKKYLQLQKIISILMIFILMIQLSGCYSYKIISSSDLTLPISIKYPYIIHSQNSKYLLKKAVILNGILSGKIDTLEDSRQIGNRIHVYLTSDSVMKINTGKILSIPLDGIAKVKMAKFEVGKTISLVVFCTSIFLFVVVVIPYMNSHIGV